MSSILDALKKVEAETPDPPWGIPLHHSRGGTRRVQPLERAARRMVPAALILTGIALILLLYIFLGPIRLNRAGREPASPALSIAPSSGRQTSETIRQTDRREPATPPAAPPVSKPAGSAPSTSSPITVTDTAPAAKPVIPAARPTPEKAAAPEPVRTPARQPDPAGSPLKSEAPAAQPERDEIAAKPYPGNPALKVQAIAWSPRPDERLAVINNVIAREGHQIGDAKILYIEPERIIIRKGSDNWELKFREP